jgi:hypothetical protein
MIDSTDFEGKFEFRPLEPGYCGLTVGNACVAFVIFFRRFAIASGWIEGVDHVFYNNFWCRWRCYRNDFEHHTLSVKWVKLIMKLLQFISGTNQITAGDFEVWPGFKC